MKTKSLLKLSAIAVFTAIIFISCNKDDDNNDVAAAANNNKVVDTNSGSLTCKIDGVNFTATTLNNTLIGDTIAKRLDVRGIDASGEHLRITIYDTDPIGTNFSHLGDTVYVDHAENGSMIIRTLGTLIFSDGSYIMSAGEGKEGGYSILTSCDLSTKNLSGLFNFMLIDFNNQDTIYVTEGKFSNLTYSEL